MYKVKSAIKKAIKKYNDIKENYFINREIGKKVELSIADLLCCNSSEGELLRYDIVVRFLAVSDFYAGSDRGFKLYRRMQDERMGNGYSVKAEKAFKALIESYDNNGYDNTSRIVLDSKLGLIDGSHRVAMALYYKFSNISALVIDTNHPVMYSIDWFIQHGFSSKDIELIIETGRMLIDNALKPFSCVIWSPAVKIAGDIIKDLGYFGKVDKVERYLYNSTEYAEIVRAVYKIDDIEHWKIETKLEHMEGYEPCIVSVDLLISNPSYRIKTCTGLPISTIGERAKKALRTKYKVQIENYFFDIILHIGDNMYQSEYMRKVFDDIKGEEENTYL